MILKAGKSTYRYRSKLPSPEYGDAIADYLSCFKLKFKIENGYIYTIRKLTNNELGKITGYCNAMMHFCVLDI